MKLAPLALVTVTFTFAACSSELAQPPTIPDPVVQAIPPTPTLTSLRGMVLDESGGCVPATIEVIGGQAVGKSVEQASCDTEEGGFTFTDLLPGVDMRLHVTAPGYNDLEETVTPTPEGAENAVVLTATRNGEGQIDTARARRRK